MVVRTPTGQWTVPTTRAVWMPAQMEHSIRMVGDVAMRTVYVLPAAAGGLPTDCAVVAVSPLLRELILEARKIALPYDMHSRDGRLMRLLLDEILQMPSLPFSLPSTLDPRLRGIETAIRQHPDDQMTAAQWAERLDVTLEVGYRSPSAFSTMFHRQFGCSPTDFFADNS